MAKKCGIYCIENTIDHKKYIGQSVDIKRRWSEHKLQLRKGIHVNSHLQRAWNKYGADVFTFTVLEECDELQLEERERYYIEFHQAVSEDLGYNMNSGGAHCSNNCRPVIDYRTGEVYPSAAHLARLLSVARQTIAIWCNERRNYMFHDEWLQLSEEERTQVQNVDWDAITQQRRYEAHKSENLSPEARRKYRQERRFNGIERNYEIYCPELDERFWGPADAKEKYGVNPRNLSSCLSGKRKHTGTHPVAGEKLTWVKVLKE